MAGGGSIIVTGSFSDASNHDIWTHRGVQVTAFAVVHCHFKQTSFHEVHTFTLQGVRYDLEGAASAATEAIHQTGSTGAPTPTVVFAAEAVDDYLVLRVNGGAAQPVEWVAHITWVSSDD